jgi:hypothetical protein
MILTQEKLLELIQEEKFDDIIEYIENKKYDEETFEEFIYTLAEEKKLNNITFFIDNYYSIINSNDLEMAVYELSNKDNNIALIKKITLTDKFESDYIDYYALKAIKNKQYVNLKYFVNNFKLNNDKVCIQIISEVLVSHNIKILDFLFDKHFYNINKEKFIPLLKFQLPRILLENEKFLIYFINKFDLYFVIENNLKIVNKKNQELFEIFFKKIKKIKIIKDF